MNRSSVPSWRFLAGLLLCLLVPGVGAAESRLDELERTLRGQPTAALAALAPLLDVARGSERVHTLMLRGALLVQVPDEDPNEATAVELDQLSATEPLAAPAAGLVRAGAWARHKPLGRADRALAEAIATLPAGTRGGVRLRFLAAQAAVRQSLGRIDEAVALFQESVRLADADGPAWRRAELRSSLAHALYRARQLDRALTVNDEAEAIAQQAGDLLAQATAANTAALLYSQLRREAEELQASERALALARQSGSKRLQAVTTANLADFYLKRGDHATALRLAQQALPLARELRDLGGEAVALANAGLAHIGLGRIGEGSRLVREALLLEERAAGLPGMADIQQEFGQALERAGQLPAAWAAFAEYRRLADEVFQRQHQQAVLELQEGLDAERRQRELTALETDTRLKEAQLLGHELQQRLWALGAVAGALLLALVTVLLRRMRRSNERLRHTNAELKVAGERDPLTGLANRRHFHAVMQQTAAARFEGSLLLIDLDHFKRINDAHGHAAGDAVLVATAQRLRSVLREPDLTVRWGGEEFLIVVRELQAERVEALAERLLAAVGGQPVQHGSELVRVTASIGFATFPLPPRHEPVRWERAVDIVDTALYLAKAHGRNRAYGVRALHPGVDGAATTLETAWRDGQAELAQLPGPAAVEVPA
jgi:diguanylate cyclase (GGDEF)-like protein